MSNQELSEAQIENCIARLVWYCEEREDNYASAWLEQLLWASYAVVDGWEGENLAERVTELGDLLPHRSRP